jgi:hypothetical protein
VLYTLNKENAAKLKHCSYFRTSTFALARDNR